MTNEDIYRQTIRAARDIITNLKMGPDDDFPDEEYEDTEEHFWDELEHRWMDVEDDVERDHLVDAFEIAKALKLIGQFFIWAARYTDQTRRGEQVASRIMGMIPPNANKETIRDVILANYSRICREYQHRHCDCTSALCWLAMKLNLDLPAVDEIDRALHNQHSGPAIYKRHSTA